MTSARLAELELAFASAPQPWREWGLELVKALGVAQRDASFDEDDFIERAAAELDLRLEVS